MKRRLEPSASTVQSQPQPWAPPPPPPLQEARSSEDLLSDLQMDMDHLGEVNDDLIRSLMADLDTGMPSLDDLDLEGKGGVGDGGEMVSTGQAEADEEEELIDFLANEVFADEDFVASELGGKGLVQEVTLGGVPLTRRDMACLRESQGRFEEISQEPVQAEESEPSPSTSEGRSSEDSSSRQTPSATPDPSKCGVCGRPVTKYVYYGARVCISCRSFFRRAVQTGNRAKFRCLDGEQCNIDPGSYRVGCQWCRFQRCLGVGMQESLVLSEEQRKERFQKSNKSKSATPAATATALSRFQPADPFTLEERCFITCLSNTIMKVNMTASFKFYTRNPDCYDSAMQFLLSGKSVPPAVMERLEDLSQSLATELYASLWEMQLLSPADRGALLAANFPAIVALFQAAVFKDKRSFLTQCVNHLREISPGDESMTKILGQMKSLSLSGEPAPIRYDRVDGRLMGSWRSGSDLFSRYANLLLMVDAWCVEDAEGPMDMQRVQILALVLLFSPVGVPLEDAAAAARVQDKYYYMLHRYLRAAHEGRRAVADKKFRQAAYVGAWIREALQLKETMKKSTGT